jgi:hypothetical protein
MVAQKVPVRHTGDHGQAFGGSKLRNRFVPRFALGFDYLDFGSATDTVGSVDVEVVATGLDLYARLVFPLSETIEAYGRPGGVFYDADVIDDVAGFDGFGDDGISVGGGIDIGRDAYAFRLEGRCIDGARDESGALVTAGVTFRF